MSSSAHRPSAGPHHTHHYVTTTTPHPASTTNTAAAAGVPQSSTTASIYQQARSRQYTHLHAQLAQLNAHLADTENLLHMTAVQAEYVRGLGAWWGAG